MFVEPSAAAADTLHQEKYSRRLVVWFYFGIVFIALTIACLVVKFWPHGSTLFNSGLSSFYWVDNKYTLPGRRLGSSLFTFGLLAIAMVFHFRPSVLQFFLAKTAKLAKPFAVCGFLIVAVLSVGWLASYISMVPPALVFILLFVIGERIKSPGMRSFWSLALTSLVSLTVFVPGLCTAPFFSDRFPDGITISESEYALVITSADRIAAGFPLYSEVNCRYGALLTVILAFFERHFGVLDFGQTIMLVRCVLAAFFLTACFLYLRYARRSRISAMAAILLIAPWFSASAACVYSPPSTPWRFIMFSVVTAFLLARNRLSGVRRWALAGALGGIAVLANFETSVSINAGIMVFLLFSEKEIFDKKAHLVRFLTAFFAGALAAFTLSAFAFVAAFGYFPPLPGILKQLTATLKLVRLGATADGSLEFFPIVFLILLHCGYLILKYATRPFGSLSGRNAFRLAISIMNLVWLAYYINMPHRTSLAANVFLYGFLLIDLLSTLRLSRLKLPMTKNSLRANLLASLLIGIFALSVSADVCVQYDSLRLRLKNDFETLRSEIVTGGKFNKAGMIRVSGVDLGKTCASEISERAAYLKSKIDASPDKKVCYITMNAVFMQKLAGPSDVPFDEAYHDPVWNGGIEMYVGLISRRKPREILIDAPDTYCSGNISREACLSYWRYLIGANYQLSRTEHGWQIWTLKQI